MGRPKKPELSPQQIEADRISKIKTDYYCAVIMERCFPERKREWWLDAKRDYDGLTTDDS